MILQSTYYKTNDLLINICYNSWTFFLYVCSSSMSKPLLIIIKLLLGYWYCIGILGIGWHKCVLPKTINPNRTVHVYIQCCNLRQLLSRLCSPSKCNFYYIFHVKFQFTWKTQVIHKLLLFLTLNDLSTSIYCLWYYPD